MNQIKDWWEQASNRDQLAVIFCGAVAMLYLLYAVLLAPVQAKREKQIKANAIMISSTAKTRELAQKVKAQMGSQQEGAGGNGSLAEEVGSSLRENKLPFSNISPSGNTDVRVRFEQVHFDNLMAWMHEMEVSKGLRVKDFSVTKTDAVGFVSVTMRLSRGA